MCESSDDTRVVSIEDLGRGRGGNTDSSGTLSSTETVVGGVGRGAAAVGLDVGATTGSSLSMRATLARACILRLLPAGSRNVSGAASSSAPNILLNAGSSWNESSIGAKPCWLDSGARDSLNTSFGGSVGPASVSLSSLALPLASTLLGTGVVDRDRSVNPADSGGSVGLVICPLSGGAIIV